MTFTDLQTEILDRLDLTSSADSTRIGRAINRVYRTVTTSIGLQLSRRTGLQQAVTIGSQLVTFTNTEKIISLQYREVSPFRTLDEITQEEMAELTAPLSDNVRRYALRSHTSDTVTITIDCVPQTAFVLYADVHTAIADLSGSNEPAFPESYHDILMYGVLVDEYDKVEKPGLSAKAEKKYEERLSQLRLWIATRNSLDIYQGKTKTTSVFSGSGGSGSGSATDGSSSWTQTGLITFDRDPSAPFAVTSGSAKVANLDADLLDGLDGSAYHKLNVASAGSLLFVDATHDIGASGATRPRDLFLSRNATIGSLLTVGGDIALTTSTAIRRTTSDGSDNGFLELAGGGAQLQSRGGFIRVLGNEHASFPGYVQLIPGNVAGSKFYVYNAAGATMWEQDATTADCLLTAGSLEIRENGTNGFLTITSTTASGQTASVDFKRNGGTVNAQVSSMSVGGNDIGVLTFYTRNSGGTLAERARVHASGGVSIGDTTDPGATNLRVAGTSALVGGISGTLSTAAINASGAVNISSSLQCDSIVNDTGLAHGTYTPTYTAVTNVDSATTTGSGKYLRVGNTVHVVARFSIDATTTLVASEVGISLPVASNFANVFDLSGVGNGETTYESGICEADTGNDRCSFKFVPVATSGQTWVVSFTYLVI